MRAKWAEFGGRRASSHWTEKGWEGRREGGRVRESEACKICEFMKLQEKEKEGENEGGNEGGRARHAW